MSNVALVVGGRNYMVNCAAGEEDHIAELGAMIDAKLTAMGSAGQNETRSLLFAALLLADEVYELKSNGPPASAPHISTGGELSYVMPDPVDHTAPGAAMIAIDPERLEGIAVRLENLAAHLEA
ncbi:MAG: zapA [Novosphingobium sp.]|nr:zapA [Novosphingobium sp.]